MIQEDNRCSRQQCVLRLGSDPSQLCKSQMSNPVADSSSQLRDYTAYRLLWSLPEVSQIRRVCVDMRETLRALSLPPAGRAFHLLLSDQSLRAQQDDIMFF